MTIMVRSHEPRQHAKLSAVSVYRSEGHVEFEHQALSVRVNSLSSTSSSRR